MGVLVWEINSVSPSLSLFEFHGTNTFEQWPTPSEYNTLTVWWWSSTRTSYRTRLGFYVCDFQPLYGLNSTVTVLGFAIISFRSLFSPCPDFDSNPIFRFWVYTKEHGTLEQLSGLSQIAAFVISRHWMSCGSKEEKWSASYLSDWNTSSSSLLALYKWRDVKEEEAALCNIYH